jgi:hypothetical protein
MTLVLRFQLPNGSSWPTAISRETRVCDIVKVLSSFWRVPPKSLSIWDGQTSLIPEAKIFLRINPKTKRDPGLSVRVDTEACSAPVSDSSVNIGAIDPRDQERILQRILQAQVKQNLRQARAANPEHCIGRNVRCLICQVHGKTLRMIVDTGASLSVLYMNQVEAVSAAYLIDRREELCVTLEGVGASVKAAGVIHSLQVRIGEVSTFIPFAVLDQPGIHGLLGIDWLRQAKATIRVESDTIEIGGCMIPLEDP